MQGNQCVNKFMIGAAIAYNIKNYMSFKVKKVNTKVAELPLVKNA
jgi:hypothetical protein